MIRQSPEDRGNIDFIIANTRLITPPHVPEIRLYLAEESLPIWQKTEDQLGEMNVPPPFWAFAWAGGQALARYLLDNRHSVTGMDVLDLGTGSGLTAIAAMQAGARSVLASDIDPMAIVAAQLNAAANSVLIATTTDDLLDQPFAGHDVVLVGDLFYERQVAERVLNYLTKAQAAGAHILVGDPQRSYFPSDRFACLAEYEVQVTRELEDSLVKKTAVWALR